MPLTQTCGHTCILRTYCALLAIGFLGLAWSACGQQFSIVDARIGTDGRLVLKHAANTNSYYILLHGNQVTAILTAKDMQFGSVGTNQLKDPNLATNAGFYRIRQVPLSSPLDTDGDGIDDVCELKYRPLLDPLNPNGANLDPDGDGRTTLEECAANRNPFVADLPEVTTISYPTNATTASFVIFSGVATTNTLIRVEGGAAYVTNAVGAGGAFDVTVALNPNRLNRLFVSASDEFGNVSAPVPIDILQDSVAPYLFIDFPTNGTVLTTSNTLVAGRVGDALSGFLGLSVTVNGVAANVDVGIGPNGTYQRGAVALNVGANQLTVMASDRLGNSITKNVTVVREEPAGPRLLAVSGDLQQTNILRRLAEPLVVKVTEAGGSPRANQLVNLQVTRSDGRLLPVNMNQLAAEITTRPDYSSNGTMFLQLFTDANGEARAWWTMGTDAGHANNRVTVSASNLQETVYFCASATALPAKQINIGSGNTQRGETLGHAPEPLKVWVSDGNNPVAGVPVTFHVVQGGGELVPIVDADGASPAGPGLRGSRPTGSITLKKARTKQGVSEVTVLTSITGHAEVDFIFGPRSGNQMVEATFTGNAGLPATFTARALARVPGQPTSFTGLIQDNAMQPIGRAFCELTVAGATLQTFSDAQGHFAFANIPSGAGHLYVNGGTALTLGTNNISSNSFPALQYTIAVVPNAENSLPTPVLLPRLNTNNAQWYYGTNDLVVTCEGIAGLKMTLKANSMKHPGGEIVSPGRPAFVSLNQVHHDDIPMPMPDGASPPFAWTLQPGGATFDPPVQVEYPNMSGLAPGAAAFFLTFNHDTERFEIVASGHVIEDGSKIVCDPGAGLTISGWGCNCPPYAVTGSCESKEDECNAVDIAANVAALTPVVAYFGRLGPITGEPFAALHLLHFLSGSGTDNHYTDGSNPVRQIQNHHRFRMKHEVLLNLMRLRVIPASDAGQSTAAGFPHYFSEGLSFYEIGLLPTTQLSAGIGRLSEGFSAVVGDIAIANDRFTAVVAYHMRDHYQFDREDCGFGGPDAWACFLQKCGVAKPFFNYFDFTLTVDAPLRPDFDELRLKSSESSEFPEDEPNLTLGPGLDASWILRIGDQTTSPDESGHFRVGNVSAPDQFGVGGPGTRPDFVSDDLIRLTGTSTKSGTTRYVFSEYFQIHQGLIIVITNLTFTDSPPIKPESLRIDADQTTLTALSQTTQLRVTAKLAEGTTTDVTPRTKWTTYRTSNPNIVSVDPNGLVIARGRGLAYVTAVNEAATAVERIVVAPGSDLTTITGIVLGTNGVPVAGATVAIFGLDIRIQTDGSGRFTLSQVPTSFGSIVLTVEWLQGNNRFLKVIRDPALVASGVTDLGNIILLPFSPESQQRFAAGETHSVALRQDNTLWSWGENSHGQLGDGTTVNRSSPAQIGSNANWRSVGAGGFHTTGLRGDGSIWAWGRNTSGQLGDGTGADQLVPTLVGTNTNWQAIAVGARHSVAVRTDGSLWTWGANFDGQLGDGTGVSRFVPVRIGSNSNWRAVTAGGSHTMALRVDGTVWGCGDNTRGQLGNGTTVSSLALTPTGTNANWTTVSAGTSHTIALRSDGSLWSWGENFEGQLGDETTANRLSPVPVGTNVNWQAVRAGSLYTIALRSDGMLLAWGDNSQGQLGDGAAERKRLSPVPVGSQIDWQTVVAGGIHTIGLRSNGMLSAAGDNFFGQLGDGTTVSQFRFAELGSSSNWQSTAGGGTHTMALRRDGTLWGWGDNYYGQLGDGTRTSQIAPLKIGSGTNWQTVALGGAHTMALRRDGTLWGWGG